MNDNNKKHLFISYATEDAPLAEWLTLRLTSEGYLVWCDRFKLLGGESYPRNIDKAIKEETFRVLAILSKNSVNKEFPTKERTLALSIGKKSGIDFMIPINKDGILPHELDWMSSDITFIPFYENWLIGFKKLLKKLESINAPKERTNGRNVVADWLCENECLFEKEEMLWTNILEILEIPQCVTRYTFKQNPKYIGLMNWVSYKQREGEIYWSFERPDIDENQILNKQLINWRERNSDKQILKTITFLLRRQIEEYCVKKGMRKNLEDRIYFPEEYRIEYTTYSGKKTYIKASFERKFKNPSGIVTIVKYHLAPVFRVDISNIEKPIIRIILRMYLTDNAGAEFKGAGVQKKRKRITKNWWNHEWLSRLIAVCQWISDGKDNIVIPIVDNQNIVINGNLIRLSSPISINEEILTENIIPNENENDIVDTDIIEDDIDEQDEQDEF